ncbi:MAG: UDP-2,3-diacylglucosamine diphosphatase [Herbaspirillum sp.]|jgi:UDP-2,3-diacylglucosamine hydrolase|nr:UDP-2,3-diacylglucosamine diphosphatase [Herbaspirillum sp.]
MNNSKAAGHGVAQSDPPRNPVALFISDLHLQASLPLTAAAFLRFLDQHALRAQRLYLLGDFFEYWAGDDDIETPFNRQMVDAIRAVADAGVQVFWIAGNRDFLASDRFAKAAGLTLLSDPHVVTLAGQTLTLAHGDAQCTDDVAYMAFRAQVRDPAWQQTFLAMPLAQRKAIIEGVRQGSQAAQKEKSSEIMDVNPQAIAKLFADTGSALLIHGHTHRSARHVLEDETGVKVRYVLPDWEMDTTPPRGGWIALGADGLLSRFDHQGNLLDSPR